MAKLGMHVLISRTIDQAPDRVLELGCDTFQMFTRNPRGWKFSKLREEEVKEFRRKTNCSATAALNLCGHSFSTSSVSSYDINLGALAGKRKRDRLSNSSVSISDDRNPILKPHWSLPPFIGCDWRYHFSKKDQQHACHSILFRNTIDERLRVMWIWIEESSEHCCLIISRCAF